MVPAALLTRRLTIGFEHRGLLAFFLPLGHSHRLYGVSPDTPIGGIWESCATLCAAFGFGDCAIEDTAREGDGISARCKSWLNVGNETRRGLGADVGLGGCGSSQPNVLGDGFLSPRINSGDFDSDGKR